MKHLYNIGRGRKEDVLGITLGPNRQGIEAIGKIGIGSINLQNCVSNVNGHNVTHLTSSLWTKVDACLFNDLSINAKHG